MDHWRLRVLYGTVQNDNKVKCVATGLVAEWHEAECHAGRDGQGIVG